MNKKSTYCKWKKYYQFKEVINFKFSPDWKNFAFITKKDNWRYAVVKNWKIINDKWFIKVENLFFSMDSNHLFYYWKYIVPWPNVDKNSKEYIKNYKKYKADTELEKEVDGLLDDFITDLNNFDKTTKSQQTPKKTTENYKSKCLSRYCEPVNLIEYKWKLVNYNAYFFIDDEIIEKSNYKYNLFYIDYSALESENILVDSEPWNYFYFNSVVDKFIFMNQTPIKNIDAWLELKFIDGKQFTYSRYVFYRENIWNNKDIYILSLGFDLIKMECTTIKK